MMEKEGQVKDDGRPTPNNYSTMTDNSFRAGLRCLLLRDLDVIVE